MGWSESNAGPFIYDPFVCELELTPFVRNAGTLRILQESSYLHGRGNMCNHSAYDNTRRTVCGFCASEHGLAAIRLA